MVASRDTVPVVASIAAVSIVGLYYAGSIKADTLEPTRAINKYSSVQLNKQPTEDSSVYTDGTYEGNGIGFRHGITTVSVTISNGQITDIQTLSTGDDYPYYSRAYPSVVSAILSSQNSSVDAVSGATFSSQGIMSAVADALSKARK
jgi:uncharacterized protein with FMN-binding domain